MLAMLAGVVVTSVVVFVVLFLCSGVVAIAFKDSIGYTGRMDGTILRLLALASPIIAVILVAVGKTRERREQTSAALRRARDEKSELARKQREQINDIVGRADGRALELDRYLKEASTFLHIAEREFSNRAFGPFWDAIENATRRSADFAASISQLRRDAQTYRRLAPDGASGRGFPVRVDQLPDAGLVASELRRVVRLGQTDYQFASILEQRLTRRVLIAGFATLGEAVAEVSDRIADEAHKLQDVFVREQSAVRHAIGETSRSIADQSKRSADRAHDDAERLRRMIDDIDRGRRPPV